MFIVLCHYPHVNVDLSNGDSFEIKATFHKGMSGIIPVFYTREDAEEFSNGRFGIIEAELGNYSHENG